MTCECGEPVIKAEEDGQSVYFEFCRFCSLNYPGFTSGYKEYQRPGYTRPIYTPPVDVDSLTKEELVKLALQEKPEPYVRKPYVYWKDRKTKSDSNLNSNSSTENEPKGQTPSSSPNL